MARPATAAVRLLTGEREPVRLATTANLETVIVDGVAWILGLKTIDGVLTAVGDRVLVKNQSDARLNGIYTASEGYWYRAADARTARTMQKGTTVHVQEGVVSGGLVYAFQTLNPVIGTSDIVISYYLSDDPLGDIGGALAAVIHIAELARDLAQQYAADAAQVSGVNVPIYASVATASGSTIAAGVKSIRTQFYAPVFTTPATLVGGANYARMSRAAITAGGYPALAYFRSADRFMPDGTTDAVNGGFWVLNESVATATMFGAREGLADNALALNALGSYCRITKAVLVLPAVATYYAVGSSIDWRDISEINGKGALIRGAFDGLSAVRIGGTGTNVLRGAKIWLEVQNTPDKSVVANTRGIHFGGMAESKLWLAARGYDEGLYFDGLTANTNWVSNEFNIITLYNNGSHVHCDLAGASYFVNNQFRGGTWYIGTNQKAAGRGTFKLTLAGTAAVEEVLIDSPQIGIDGGSAGVSHAAFIYAALGSTSNLTTVFFKNARIETYSAFTNTLALVNVPSATGFASFNIDLLSASGIDDANILSPDLKRLFVSLRDMSNRPTGGANLVRRFQGERFFPVQAEGRITVPGVVLYDSATGGYTAPSPFLTNGVTARTSRANGDGQLVVSSSGQAVGHIYKKANTTQHAFLNFLNGSRAITVICFDASGTVLSGNAPYYAKGSNGQSIARTGASVYEFSTNWLWIHPSVASFFVGASGWIGATIIESIDFEQGFAAPILRLRDQETDISRLCYSFLMESYLPVGATIERAQFGGYRNTFLLKTTVSTAAISGATTIGLASVAGITAGDRIGIELDTVITGAELQWHHTTVNGAPSANTVTLTNALPAAAAAGRAVRLNRWVVR
ncbi:MULTISPECIES: hypothetical protein [unclassified Mesorhizobium]|uniref:hypothetical protein n=1 Tax=unclassified Mesorhizobium TaxID=325217 RepID=UPI0011273637|nr:MULTISPECIES: hypothetical protein [unclassified Mesorhizobium]MBZ9920098.1 hypothetical protein [Mesorhizobium sp. BR1-1-7]MBZ9955092.1 hypothetical protein [Mesorhizobium sp. BR1-1-15]MBZ9971710.1 hypothetical protein [Mesorhizobium sp. BR1-1-12]TPK68235.1 hypothetical protein FJ551_00395 [Mesorhizobium sp. B2-5-1]TPM62480.1 hypothetical protein FJ962_08735 [Mesorhizobium sp. B2-1-9]